MRPPDERLTRPRRQQRTNRPRRAPYTASAILADVLRPTITALALAAMALVPTACGADRDAGAGQTPSASQVRADTLAAVARRVYHQETHGEVGHAAAKRIARDRALLTALRGDHRPALRAEALRQLFNPGKHVVRLSVARGGRTLTDVGGAFVVAPTGRALRAVDGTALGRLEVSMQDVIGYVKLVHRLTGAQVVVRGRTGQVESSLAAARSVALPASGQVTLAGGAYVVRSFTEIGYGGERLSVWILTH